MRYREQVPQILPPPWVRPGAPDLVWLCRIRRMSKDFSDDEAPEGVSFAFAAAAAAAHDEQPARPTKRRRGLSRLHIAPVPVSAEMLEMLSQQQQSQAAVSVPSAAADEDVETPDEKRRRLRRQQRAKLAQEASREQKRSLLRHEVRQVK